MAADSKIEWTDATWNPVGGCSIHSPGCAHCYAMKLAARHPEHPVYAGTVQPSKAGPVWTGKLTVAPDDHHVWTWPLSWRGAKAPVMAGKVRCIHCGTPTARRFMMCDVAAGNWCPSCFDKTPCGLGKHGEGCPTLVAEDIPSLIFVGDMSDLFHQDRPDAHIDRVFGVIGACDDAGKPHIFQLLTKRSDRMRDYLATRGYAAWNARRLGREAWPPRNIWFGTSVERQQEADARRGDLAAIAKPGVTTFVSYEPALGPVDWRGWEFVKQIISGGESDRDGKSARPSHPDWHRAARDFCAAHGIAYFFKQWGEYLPVGQILPGYGKVHGATAVKPGRMKLHYGGTPKQAPKHAFAERGVEFASTADGRLTFRLGKARAGRLLDGREHNDFPGPLEMKEHAQCA